MIDNFEKLLKIDAYWIMKGIRKIYNRICLLTVVYVSPGAPWIIIYTTTQGSDT